MSQGHLDVEIESQGNNEISNLIDSFIQLRDSFKENIEKEKSLTLEKIKNERLIAIGETAARFAHDIRNPTTRRPLTSLSDPQ